MISMLYNNVIAPKIQEQNGDDSRSKCSRSSVKSKSSSFSSGTLIRPKLLPFTVHANRGLGDGIFKSEG